MLLLLLILVQLSDSIKLNNEFLEEPKDVETIIGSTLIFRCLTEPLDESEVTWCKNDFCTLGKTRDLPFYPRYEIIGDAHQGEHHFKIINVSLEDIGMYQCQILAGPQRAGSMSRKAKLTVLQIPTSLSIDNPVILIENVLSYLVCRANNAMPEAKLSWHLPKSLNYLSKNDYALLSDHSLRNSISNLTLIANRSYHGLEIQCQAHSLAIQTLNKTLITKQYIQTIFSPEINLNVIGQQIENKILSIHCDIQCRPELKKIQWFNGSYLLKSNNENHLSILLTRYMHHNQIICQAINQVGITNQSITLEINYKPIFVDIDGNEINNSSVILINEGESIQLECLVDSYPSSLISWKFNNKIISINKIFIQINPIQFNKHLGYYICMANHSLFGIFNRTIRLALKGPPEIIEEKQIHSVYIGQSITFICLITKDLPIQNVYWSREDQSKLNSNEKYKINENQNKNLIENKLLIKNILSSDHGYYICTASNQYGSSITKFQLNVIHYKIYFIRRFILYSSIFIGISISFILIIITFIHHYRLKTRQKSSTTDETISSLPKQQEHIQQVYQDDINSNVDQYLIQEQFNQNDLFDYPQDDLFYLKENQKRYSTVV